MLGAAALVVGGDTGPVHLAASLGVPTIAIHLTTDPLRNGPLGDRTTFVSAALPGRGHRGSATTGRARAVAADEIEDPRPYCEIIRQWSTLHPEFAFLPRKFKIAVTGAPNMRPYLGQSGLRLKVPFAMEGARLYDGHSDTPKIATLKKSKIRGVPSRAMVCSHRCLQPLQA